MDSLERNTSIVHSNLSESKSDQNSSVLNPNQFPKSRHSASMRSSNLSKSNSHLSDSNKDDCSVSLKISEDTQMIQDNNKDFDTESEKTIHKRNKVYEAMNESIAKHFLISGIIENYNVFSEMDNVGKIAELNRAYSKVFDYLEDDQAKLNDYKAYIECKIDVDCFNCIKIQLEFFNDEFNTKKTWFSNNESILLNSIHDSNNQIDVYYKEICEFYWEYIKSSVCKICRCFRAQTKESSEIYAEESEYINFSKYVKKSLDYEKGKCQGITDAQNKLRFIIKNLSNENHSLQSKLNNTTQERDEFNNKIAELEAMFKEEQQKNKSLTLIIDDLKSKELELINQINTANQFINTIKKTPKEPNSEISQINKSINDKLKSQTILKGPKRNVKSVKIDLSDLIRIKNQKNINLKLENENVVTSEKKHLYSSETAIPLKENDVQNNQVCLDNKFEEEETQRFKSSISKNLSNEYLITNKTNSVLDKPEFPHFTQRNQHSIATFPASVSSEILKTNLLSEPDQL